MCLSCGCLRPGDQHGDPDNITMVDLAAAAAAGDTGLAEAAWNIPRTLTVATTPAWPPTLAGLTTRPTLVWDVDGVLAFTAEAICTALNARYGTTYDPASQGFFTGVIRVGMLPMDQGAWLLAMMPSMLGGMAPDWHAIDTMTDASAAGYPSVIVTERLPGTGEATAAWLRGWGVNAPYVTAVGPGNKPAYLAGQYGPHNPAVLIDDNPVTMQTIARDGISVWLPERPYNTSQPARDYTRRFPAWPVMRYWLGLAPA